MMKFVRKTSRKEIETFLLKMVGLSTRLYCYELNGGRMKIINIYSYINCNSLPRSYIHLYHKQHSRIWEKQHPVSRIEIQSVSTPSNLYVLDLQ